VEAVSEQDLLHEIARLQAIGTVTGVVLLLVGLVLSLLPVDYCDECQHCRRGAAGSQMCPQHRKPKSQCEDEHRP
jgi:hypothetical protein